MKMAGLAGLCPTKELFAQARGFIKIVLTDFDQVIPGQQPFNLVEAKTARFIINDVVDALGARVLQFQDLVDLLLIFGDGRDDFDFAKKVPEFFERRAGIGRHCIGTPATKQPACRRTTVHGYRPE